MIHRPLARRTLAGVTAGMIVLGVVPAVGSPMSNAATSVTTLNRSTLLVVGDSLTVGAAALGQFSGSRPSVKSHWTKVVIDAKVGRTARQGVNVVKTRLKNTRATALLVALGTNDMMGKRDAAFVRALIDDMMVSAGRRPVLWVNLEFGSRPARERPARARMFNTELTRATKRWSNLRVANWNTSFTPNGRSRFLADGVHLTTSGYKTRATFYAREVAAFRTWIDTVLNSTTTSSTTTTISTTTTSVPESTTTVATTSTTTSTDPSASTTSSAP